MSEKPCGEGRSQSETRVGSTVWPRPPVARRRGCGERLDGLAAWPLRRHCTLQPETSRFICRILDRNLISIGRQPVLIAASRCYLIHMLQSALTCANGCSCWSADEENSP